MVLVMAENAFCRGCGEIRHRKHAGDTINMMWRNEHEENGSTNPIAFDGDEPVDFLRENGEQHK